MTDDARDTVNIRPLRSKRCNEADVKMAGRQTERR
jgi:hypothetical protein